MRAFVTGAAGFIGSHLVEALHRAGCEVMGFDKSDNVWATPAVEWVQADIANAKSLYHAVLGFRPELIFHLAAESRIMNTLLNPLESHEANLTGTLHLLDAARTLQCKRVVYASSSAVYGEAVGGTPDKPAPVNEDHVCRPLSNYGVQNLASEHYANVYEHIYGLRTVILRMFNVYGPRQVGAGPARNAVPAFLRALLTREQPVLYGDGEQTRDMLYVDDAVRAFVMVGLSEKPVVPDTLNIGSGEQTAMKALLKEIADILGVKVEPRMDPARKGESRHMWADIRAAEKAVGWKPEVKLRDGLRKTAEWFREFIKKEGAARRL
jgi:nucleoside-diphosphate-sugar epimerase